MEQQHPPSNAPPSATAAGVPTVDYLVDILRLKSASDTRPTPDVVPFSQLVQEPRVGEKDGDATVFASVSNCLTRCRNHGTGQFDCGGGKLHRLKENADEITALPGDFDNLTEAEADVVCDVVEHLPYATHLHETWSSGSPGKGIRLRLLVQTTAIKTAGVDFKATRRKAFEALGLGPVMHRLDDTDNPAGLFYNYSKPTAVDERQHEYHPGGAFDLSTCIVQVGASVAPTQVVAQHVERDEALRVDVEAVRKELRRERAAEGTNRETRKRLADGQALSPPPSKNAPFSRVPRGLAWFRVIGSLTMLKCFDPKHSSTPYLEQIIRPSWLVECAEAEAAGVDHTDWNKIVDMLERSRETAAQKKAEREAQAAIDWETTRKVREKYGADAPAVDTSATEEMPDWFRLLNWKLKDGEPIGLLQDSLNLYRLLKYHDEWAGKIRLNEVTQEIELHGRQMIDADYTTLRNWCQEHFKVSFTKDDVYAQVELIAHDCAYDPQRERIEALPEWDKVDRLAQLPEIFRALADTDDERRHNESVFRRWFISLIARSMRPGCKVDSMLVLYSARQGKRKSTACQIIGGKYFADQAVDVTNKDSFELAGKSVVWEIGELAGLEWNYRQQLLAFLSRPVDRYRPSYGRVIRSFPRRAVFVGTTNKADFLSDTSGNRRFWVVRIGDEQVDTTRLEAELDQLLAEAKVAYDAGEPWWLTEEEAARSERRARSFRPSNVMAEEIERKILSQAPAQRPASLRISDVARLLYPGAPDRATREERRIVTALETLDFERDGNQRWRMPEALRTAPHSSTAIATSPAGDGDNVVPMRGRK